LTALQSSFAVWTFCIGRSAVVFAPKGGFSALQEADFLTFFAAAISL
jgi:hypothetical protein